MLVIGAKGFAKQLLEVLEQLNKTENLSFYDDLSTDGAALLFNKFKIIKNIDEAKKYFNTVSPDYALGTGNPELRKSLSEKFNAIGGKVRTIISPRALISKHNCYIADGVSILSNCVIESDVTIGYGSLINLNSTITHDTTIGKFCEVSPGAILSGGCSVGDMTFIGAGAVLLPKVKVGKNVTIGAGSVVTKDIEDNQTVAGAPAKPVQK